MTKILIEVRGGNIVNIIATADLNIKIVDWDNIETDNSALEIVAKAIKYQSPDEVFSHRAFDSLYV